MSVADPLKWYQQVSQLQRSLNSSVTRSTNKTPFEIAFGVKMRNPEDVPLASAIEEALIEQFDAFIVELFDTNNAGKSKRGYR